MTPRELEMRRRREQASRDAIFVNGSPEGERLLGYLLALCQVFDTSVPPDGNPHMTLFNEGRRSVGNEIVALIVSEPNRFRAEFLRSISAQAEGNEL